MKIWPYFLIFFSICNSKAVHGVVAMIRLYQKTISPDHGILYSIARQHHCRFFPSCSDYAIISLRQYGLAYGTMLFFKRLVRCHPYSSGGYDPVKTDR